MAPRPACATFRPEAKKESPTLLDVHPPHEPIHGVRDFLLHIATITIGLLIALGLEATVEHLHHRHLLSEARENIHREITQNQQLLPRNAAHLQADAQSLRDDIVVIRQLRDHPRSPHGQLAYNLAWSGFADAAFATAHGTGAVAYMSYGELEDLSTVYAQQDYLNTLGKTLFTDQSKAPGVLASETRLEDLQLEQLAQLMTRTTDLLSQVEALQGHLNLLAKQYDTVARLEDHR